MALNDADVRLMKLELELLIANLHTDQYKSKCEVYEGILTQLPKLLTVMGMGEASAQEQALRLLSTLVESLEQFWRDIGEEGQHT